MLKSLGPLRRIVVCGLVLSVFCFCLCLAPLVIERALHLGWTPVTEFGLLPLIITVTFGVLSIGVTMWEHA